MAIGLEQPLDISRRGTNLVRRKSGTFTTVVNDSVYFRMPAGPSGIIVAGIVVVTGGGMTNAQWQQLQIFCGVDNSPTQTEGCPIAYYDLPTQNQPSAGAALVGAAVSLRGWYDQNLSDNNAAARIAMNCGLWQSQDNSGVHGADGVMTCRASLGATGVSRSTTLTLYIVPAISVPSAGPTLPATAAAPATCP